MIRDLKGRFVIVPIDASLEAITQKARELLIECDIRDNSRPSFGGGEYSDSAVVAARAARAGSSVNLTYANGTFNASWK
ncbi:hypothetical protein O1611_g3417 [Lasiodiplodia mahajangana]|uniref:Uncharacterized protein n=1 Tax=Lasiodiplodia mahajangana TaxID=1108764 RepID=A0ACC2JSH7_9PEZI|nr:hypothetical protein O1611_g3417 [Lasiodiplodia mahajangana]